MSYIEYAFKSARKDPVNSAWVEVEAIFNGDVTKRLCVLRDGSDVVEAVTWCKRHLEKWYPGYEFQFNAFVK